MNGMTWQTQELYRDGDSVAIHRHRAQEGAKAEWGELLSQQRDTFEVCLNLEGRAELIAGGVRTVLEPGRVVYYRPHVEWTKLRRYRGGVHDFVSVRMGGEYLRQRLESAKFSLRTDLRASIFEEYGAEPMCRKRRMLRSDWRWLELVEDKELNGAAQRLYLDSKVMELIARNFFIDETAEEEALFCKQYNRAMAEKVEMVKRHLERHFAEVIKLEELAKAVGSSPTHLSRSFTQVCGLTMRQYLRRIRVRHGRRLILAGRHNVTEAAFDCGYQSLSHFSKAFQEEFGMTPSEFIRQQRQMTG